MISCNFLNPNYLTLARTCAYCTQSHVLYIALNSIPSKLIFRRYPSLSIDYQV